MGAAGEKAIGWEQGTFLSAYEDARTHLTDMAIDADPVAVAVIRMMETVKGATWTGTPSQLLDTLEAFADARMIKSRDWPKAANVLSNHLRRCSADLQAKNIAIEWGKSGNRFISIQRMAEDDSFENLARFDRGEAKAWVKGTI